MCTTTTTSISSEYLFAVQFRRMHEHRGGDWGQRQIQKPIINSRRVCANFSNIYCLMSIHINVYMNLPCAFVCWERVFFSYHLTWSSSCSHLHPLPPLISSHIDIDSIWNPRRTVCLPPWICIALKEYRCYLSHCVHTVHHLCVHIVWKTLISAEENSEDETCTHIIISVKCYKVLRCCEA